MALFRLPPLVPVNELRQVGRLLGISDYELVLQQLLSSGSLENTRAQIITRRSFSFILLCST